MDEEHGSQNTGLVGRDLVKSYGAATVLKSVDFSVTPGSVVGLIGENGAGKSTLNSIIAGVVRPDGGHMMIDGEPYAPTTPSEAIARGVALIHQEIRLLPGLSVAENIFLGRFPTRAGRIDQARMVAESRRVLDSLGIDLDPRRLVGGLSMAVQQGIEIAKAILRKPRYIFFDEPTASLGDSETERIFEQIASLKAYGAGIVYVSHRLEEIRALSDWVVCLRDGERVASWDHANLEQQEMINAMVGREFSFEHRAPAACRERTAISLRGLERRGIFQDISFDVADGEILGFAGLMGAGRTEVVRTIAGADRLDRGEVWVDGERVRYRTPSGAIKVGIFMVPEDRKSQGLNLGRSAAENITLPWERRMPKRGLITARAVQTIGDQQKERFDIRGRLGLPIGAMSGGNQQKVLFSKWLVEKPRVFIVDEPTRGVDVGAKMAIYDTIRSLAAEGIAVIVVSSELEEVLGLCHRVLVMSRGRQRGILRREEATPNRVMSLAVSA